MLTEEKENVTEAVRGTKRAASPNEPESKKLKVSEVEEKKDDDVIEIIDDVVPDEPVPHDKESEKVADESRQNESPERTPVKDSTRMVGTPASVNRKSSRTPKTPTTNKKDREAAKQKQLEEKQKRLEERERLKAEKEKIKAEKERIAEEKRKEKEKRDQDKEEKRKEEELKKEERRKEKEKLEEEAARKKEEKEKKRREEEEKKEAKRKEDEEKKREEEELRRREEDKKKRISQRFIGFFSKVEKTEKAPEPVVNGCWYLPFHLKEGVTMAPVLRRDPLPVSVDIFTQKPEITAKTYLKSDGCKNRKIVGTGKGELRAKLFQFHDSYRPPYYGTWRKRNLTIRARKPWSQAHIGIDYEVDSDEEWEDEPSDGEECKSDDEEEAGNDEDCDSDGEGFFVDPGYLSDGEGADAESTEDGLEEDAEERRERLAARAQEWRAQVQRKQRPLVACVLGPLYRATEGGSSLPAGQGASSLTGQGPSLPCSLTGQGPTHPTSLVGQGPAHPTLYYKAVVF